MVTIFADINKGRIIQYLSKNETATREELSKFLSVSKNTVSRYITDINTGGLYYIETLHDKHGSYKLESRDVKKDLTVDNDEIECLLMAKDIIQNKCSDVFPEFENFCTRITSSNSLSEKVYKHLIMKPDISMEDVLSESEKKDTIHKAIADSKIVEVLESDIINEEASRKKIHPYGLVDFNKITYLIGYCEIRRNLRVIKLNNITNCTILDDNFTKEINFTDEELVRFCAGVHKKSHFDMELIISFPFDEIIQSRVWSNDQEIKRIDEDTIEFTATMEGEDEIITWLLSMKDKVEIVSPEYIKKKYYNTIRSMLHNVEKTYEKKVGIEAL